MRNCTREMVCILIAGLLAACGSTLPGPSSSEASTVNGASSEGTGSETASASAGVPCGDSNNSGNPNASGNPNGLPPPNAFAYAYIYYGPLGSGGGSIAGGAAGEPYGNVMLTTDPNACDGGHFLPKQGALILEGNFSASGAPLMPYVVTPTSEAQCRLYGAAPSAAAKEISGQLLPNAELISRDSNGYQFYVPYALTVAGQAATLHQSQDHAGQVNVVAKSCAFAAGPDTVVSCHQ